MANNKGKKKVSKRKKKQRSKLQRNIRMGIKIGVLGILNLILIVGIFVALKYGNRILKYQEEAKSLVANSTTDTFRQSETSLVYDADGKVLSVLKGAKDVYYISYEDIPTYIKDAIVSIEDKKFYKHNGIDLKANIRAFFSLVKNKGEIRQGASTITQQLSRNIFLSNKKSYERKIKEIFISLELEKKYSKSQILEFYLNNIYFANGYYGIEAASKGYFNKSVNKLSLSQMAFLCAIPNNPTLYNPVEHKENTIKRRDRILKQMYQDGRIDSDIYAKAVDTDIKLKTKTRDKNNYVETYVYNSAIKALMKQDGFEFKNKFNSDAEKEAYDDQYTEAYNQYQQMLYTEGYRIYTSIDLKKQAKLQESVDDTLKAFKDKTKDGVYKLQSAATCIDNETGLVVAIVGGRYQKADGFTLNRAFQSYRQPGSSIKPLIVYTPSFERNYTPNSIVEDKKIEGGPNNSGGSHLGKITVRRAVEKSINTIAWQLFGELTPKVGLEYLYQMNFARISSKDLGLASSLGGLTNGVNTVEMASGYATLENDGIYREPTCIVKILDSDGNEIVRNTSDEKKIYDVNAARMMTNVLQGVVTEGTARGLKIPNMPTAAKTGTTNQSKDGWFVGYTPYYTTSVWVGYDMPKTLDNLFGATYPGQIWYQFMKQINEGLEAREFPTYDGAGKEVEPTATPEATVDPGTLNEVPADATDSPDAGADGSDVSTEAPMDNGGDNNSGDDNTVTPTEAPVETATPDDSSNNTVTPSPDDSTNGDQTTSPDGTSTQDGQTVNPETTAP
ncbi:PBP1A family penicillin-binding protein [Anaeromicropila herbilytica]|uniref:Penicillin-binding protein 1A n=1 Tax=Anaeromicropila herbilytica TaxID=2785025 RepID=A0A7R7EHQ3_9FIRM|nr:PBP1A family penicillin-binding protein [Anaeromicropila herbilytica]BCN28959.1 penicillin-binding protein 4 [Anaeromicropila herbilytica]